MSRAGLLMLLGALVVLTPVSGLPLSMRAVLEFIFGAAVFLLGLTLRMRDMRRSREALGQQLQPDPSPPETVVSEEAVEPVQPSAPDDSTQMGAF